MIFRQEFFADQQEEDIGQYLNFEPPTDEDLTRQAFQQATADPNFQRKVMDIVQGGGTQPAADPTPDRMSRYQELDAELRELEQQFQSGKKIDEAAYSVKDRERDRLYREMQMEAWQGNQQSAPKAAQQASFNHNQEIRQYVSSRMNDLRSVHRVDNIKLYNQLFSKAAEGMLNAPDVLNDQRKFRGALPLVEGYALMAYNKAIQAGGADLPAGTGQGVKTNVDDYFGDLTEVDKDLLRMGKHPFLDDMDKARKPRRYREGRGFYAELPDRTPKYEKGREPV